MLCDFQDGVGRTDTAGRYALFWELVTALRVTNFSGRKNGKTSSPIS